MAMRASGRSPQRVPVRISFCSRAARTRRVRFALSFRSPAAASWTPTWRVSCGSGWRLTDRSVKLPFEAMATIEERTAAGVSFGLTDEQKALRDLAHDFAEREIRPKEREYDEGSIHPADVIAKAHGLGLMNVHIPEAYGGPDLGAFEGMLIGEELCWGCSGIGSAISA